MKFFIHNIILLITVSLYISCESPVSSNKEMIDLLGAIANDAEVMGNNFSSSSKIYFYDSSLRAASNAHDSAVASYRLANAWMEMGEEQKSIPIFEDLLHSTWAKDSINRINVLKQLALSWLRAGERMNCIHDHTVQSCIFPIKENGIHQDPLGSQKAITIYEELLQSDSNDLASKWLLNVAYMTINGYPLEVPPAYLLKGLDADTAYTVKPFMDVAAVANLNINNMSGGSIIEDFNNDGYLDVVTSSWDLHEGMHYFQNNGDGSFEDLSEASGLSDFTGGLNIMQTDYNNDGLKDIFVVRGAWKGKFGREPNSLLKNNGDGPDGHPTFTDVTKESGLLSFYPTQTATWADFNNDGWLDVFIGNEAASIKNYHPCELYINNKDGTFTEMASEAGCNIIAFVKGVTSGDFNNDGFIDIFISTLNGRKTLLKNEGPKNGLVYFTDVTVQSGLRYNQVPTFPTWFWDYDNDGWLDIIIFSYEFTKSLAWYAAAEAMGRPTGNASKIFLYRNNRDGTFEEVSSKTNLNRIAFAMGVNFGDIDNDGFLDFYVGTGNPTLSSQVPNKLFKNIDGNQFVDITTSARVGNLQKGHGVSMADLDHDGDIDIYIEMGGAYLGDAYQNSLFMNPGQNNNHWINFNLKGVTANNAAIGARIKLFFVENGVQRTIYRDVNSGGSFGSNPLLQHIGIGQASEIDKVEIIWPGSRTVQEIKNLRADATYMITEGNPTPEKIVLKKLDLTSGKQESMDHAFHR